MLYIQRQVEYDHIFNNDYISTKADYDANIAQQHKLSAQIKHLEAELQKLVDAAATIEKELDVLRPASQQLHISDMPCEVIHLIYSHVDRKYRAEWSRVCKMFCYTRFEHVDSIKIQSNRLEAPLKCIRYAKTCHLCIVSDLSKHKLVYANQQIDYINQILERSSNGYATLKISFGSHTTRRKMIIAPRVSLSASACFSQICRPALQTIVGLRPDNLDNLNYYNDDNPTWLFPNLRHLFVKCELRNGMYKRKRIIAGAPKYMVCNRSTLLAILYKQLYFPDTVFILTDNYERLRANVHDWDSNVTYDILENSSDGDNLFKFYKAISAYGSKKYPPLRVATTDPTYIPHLLHITNYTHVVQKSTSDNTTPPIYHEVLTKPMLELLAEVTDQTTSAMSCIKNDGRYPYNIANKLINLYVAISEHNAKYTKTTPKRREELLSTCEYCGQMTGCDCYKVNKCDHHPFTEIKCPHNKLCKACSRCKNCGGLPAYKESAVLDDDQSDPITEVSFQASSSDDDEEDADEEVDN